jgi:putative flippase GtrA
LNIEVKFRYLICGIFNTLFAYFSGLFIYHFLNNKLSITFISLICYVASISVTYLTYKLFVFKTKGNWIYEYVRCYFVYGSVIIIGILSTTLFVNFFHIPFWISQLVTIFIGILVSFFAHTKFTFK